jgi:hypothetical protein
MKQMILQQKIEQLSINIKSQSGNFPDLVSLALHQLAAVRLQTNPALIETAKSNLNKWLDKTPNVTAWLEWQNILETKSLKKVLEIMTAETGEGQRLRSSSPFAGLVTEQERHTVIEYCEKAKPF